MGLGHPEKAGRMAVGFNWLGELGNSFRRKNCGGGGAGEMTAQGESVWCPWAAILACTEALSHNAIRLLLLLIPKGPF